MFDPPTQFVVFETSQHKSWFGHRISHDCDVVLGVSVNNRRSCTARMRWTNNEVSMALNLCCTTLMSFSVFGCLLSSRRVLIGRVIYTLHHRQFNFNVRTKTSLRILKTSAGAGTHKFIHFSFLVKLLGQFELAAWTTKDGKQNGLKFIRRLFSSVESARQHNN